MIVFNNVTKKYGDNVGLINASVHINSGDFVFLVGPSGAGKTTFIKLILKEIEPDSGRIILAGKDITRIKKREVPKIRQTMRTWLSRWKSFTSAEGTSRKECLMYSIWWI